VTRIRCGVGKDAFFAMNIFISFVTAIDAASSLCLLCGNPVIQPSRHSCEPNLCIAQTVMENPALRSSLASMCASAGVSVRTLQRAFRRCVGIDFESWRRQVRLMKAVELLVSGHSVKEVAFLVGYQEPTAFVALFRATFGTTPKAWISTLDSLSRG
jgi:AraC-like DNA-binding protein